MQNYAKCHVIILATISLLANGYIGDVRAQGEKKALALEEIIVTAQKREQNLQNVPLSIDAFDVGQMEMRGMERVEDLLAQIPNAFSSSRTISDSRFAIRGIPGVSFFVDGIWQRTIVLLRERSVLELERVEVLKGPQGTLYGRDSTGGAINLVTKAPAEEFGARVSGTVGSYDRRDFSINVDVPLAGTFFTKLTLVGENRDGYVDSLTVDRSYGEIDNQLLRADMLWKPIPKFQARLTYQDLEQKTTHPQVSVYVVDPGAPGPSPGLGTVVPPRQFYEIAGFQWNNLTHAAGFPGGEVKEFQTKSNWNAGQHGVYVDQKAVTLNLNYDLTDDVNLTSITGYIDQSDSAHSDLDGSEFDFFAAQQINRDETWTEELRLSGNLNRFTWMLGGYYWDFSRLYRQFQWGFTDLNVSRTGPILTSPQCQVAPTPGYTPCRGIANRDNFFGISEEGKAVFGEVTTDLSDLVRGLALTIGGRYQKEDIETWAETPTADTVTIADIPTPGELVAGDYFASSGRTDDLKQSFNKATYRAALSYQFNDDAMVYYNWSQGSNAGGARKVTIPNAVGVPVIVTFVFGPEDVEQHEVGLRSDWFDGRARANLSMFRVDWTNLQLQSQIVSPFTGELLPTSTILNVAKAKAQGVELTTSALLTDQLKFDGSVGFLDTNYTKIDPGVTAVKLGDSFGGAPRWQVGLGLEWGTDLSQFGGGRLILRTDYNWTDAFNRDYSPDSQASASIPGRKYDQASYGLLNARAVFVSADGKWEFSVFGTNLTDEFYLNGGYLRTVLALDFGSVGRPREFGAKIKFFID